MPSTAKKARARTRGPDRSSNASKHVSGGAGSEKTLGFAAGSFRERGCELSGGVRVLTVAERLGVSGLRQLCGS
jgi:hypothetical protein